MVEGAVVGLPGTRILRLRLVCYLLQQQQQEEQEEEQEQEQDGQ